jgi:hypothetical protein
MAKHATSIPVPTRRALFGGALALTAAATTAHAEYRKVCRGQRSQLLTTNDCQNFIAAYDRMRARRQGFIDQVAFLHPDGMTAATNAMAAGMDPDCCTMIVLDWSDAKPGMLPALQFKQGGAFRTFRPRGEDL